MVDDVDWDSDVGCMCDWVPGCYYLIRRALVDEIGLFDPRYFLYYEEVDHCLAAKTRGWEIHYFPGTTVVHIGGESAKADGKLTSSGGQLAPLEIESAMLFFRKNYGWWAVIAHLLLSLAASVIEVAKRLLKWKRPFGFGEFSQRLVLQSRAFVRTGMGARPTR
jgi:N-acetylglucosaminyl-diphospho-decaprenol L-rhamnosyltransferase